MMRFAPHRILGLQTTVRLRGNGHNEGSGGLVYGRGHLPVSGSVQRLIQSFTVSCQRILLAGLLTQ